jgi:hypothetical protein
MTEIACVPIEQVRQQVFAFSFRGLHAAEQVGHRFQLARFQVLTELFAENILRVSEQNTATALYDEAQFRNFMVEDQVRGVP